MLADQYTSINERLKEIEAERRSNITGTSFTGVPTGGTSTSLCLKASDLPPYTPSSMNEAARRYMADIMTFDLPDLRGRVRIAANNQV